MLGSCQCALYVQLVMIGLSQILQQLSPIEFTIEFIHLGNFNGLFLQITFRKATHYIKLLQVSFLLGLRKFQNHINGFLLGVVIGISDQFKIPVKYIGLGEGMEDLQVFRKKEFVDSLFGENA